MGGIQVKGFWQCRGGGCGGNKKRKREREKGRESERDGGTGENKVSTLNNEVVSNRGR